MYRQARRQRQRAVVSCLVLSWLLTSGSMNGRVRGFIDSFAYYAHTKLLFVTIWQAHDNNESVASVSHSKTFYF